LAQIRQKFKTLVKRRGEKLVWCACR